ncbi:mediator complex subunit MED4 [Toxoplasma gondii TgCatPRC2]|uniref:Mediator complex subunit MED4 n=8 Tax=Toxoplasma gondii TaxID=5811 RepID=A0A151HQY4_TOXGO|nr:mediator complex subunit MED4 [Toxoplasma gondii ME49]KFG31303.1 mediator complex subunit MED4 [Toxoplasma gondii p89]KFG45823.1 mediator complex subunit MED4 [Toxoplasma gondii GAB2-2007-GAL-DOM2]KFG53841.1 mediator complex subunit MED4 [Toxoplasma gondii FOU]KYF42234.1 mediator complex subunit MED4 [Toxoplasma gondii ARI]KYK71690.1 mediator complex subunit MED4 [Toxoplasma gondii TgCatPRC2]PUA91441.1 mediator complex subunit MED4 [Toxoplasma gondii TgCATBr9]RQX68301.1 mediator complex s|eukprot:XP_018635901.1 mediator complex subunit MED4 [Toxoplasma gondii ME49]
MAPPSAPAVAASSPSLQELYNLLRSVVKPEWSHILDPASDEWKKKFRERVDAETSVTSPPLSSTSSASTNDCAQSFSACSTLSDGSSVCSLPREQQLHLLVKMSSILETPWLVAQKRLEGIKEAEKARPLTLDQVVTYARRLGGSTAAPPETANISDVVTHQSIYPTFHFLPYPSMEELQTSRLGFLASKPFDRVCFPPEIRSQWTVRLRKSERSCDEEGDSRAGTETNVPGYEVRLVCQTPGAQLVYCVFDGLLAPNALPAQPLWKETRYTSEAPVFLSTPFPKTLVARALKPPLQPSRPTLLRLNPRNLATQSPARSLPSGRPRLPAPQAPAQREREEGGDAATAEREAQRDAQTKRGREEETTRGLREQGRGDRSSTAFEGGRETRSPGEKDSSERGGSDAVAGRTQGAPSAPQAPQSASRLLAASLASGEQAHATPPASASASLASQASVPPGRALPANDARVGGSFQGLMLGSSRRKRREEIVQRQEAAQDSSGSAESSSSGEESSDEEEKGSG